LIEKKHPHTCTHTHGPQLKNELLAGYFVDATHPGAWGHLLIASVVSFTLRDMVANLAEIEANYHVADLAWEQNRKFLVLPRDWAPLKVSFFADFLNKTTVETHTNLDTSLIEELTQLFSQLFSKKKKAAPWHRQTHRLTYTSITLPSSQISQSGLATSYYAAIMHLPLEIAQEVGSFLF
jgi:hypothetical protein